MTIPSQSHSAEALMKKIQSLPTDRIAEVEDFVDFLRERARLLKTSAPDTEHLDLPVDDLGPWPEGVSLHREDMYGDNRR